MDIFDFLLVLLRQFAGGPGPVENNLVRFGLAAIFWAVLFYIAWSRQRSSELPREKLLVWGFGLALVREFYMFGQIAWKIVDANRAEASCSVTEPVEHALLMVAVVVVAGAFLRYILDDAVLSSRFLQVGLGIAAISLLITAFLWPSWLAGFPALKFHQTWLAWLFHLPLSAMLLAAIYFIWKKPGWLRNLVISALVLYFISEVLFLLNYSTGRAYASVLCPLGNTFHILAIPLLGFVYLREQTLEKEQAEADLRNYRDHLEDLVKDRTAELTQVNQRLQLEVTERRQAEEALARISQRNELILTSAGEGICGIDTEGRFIFVNPAAAAMLGYQPEELVNHYCHPLWHEYRSDGIRYPEENCPIYAGYRLGISQHGDDEFFTRKDGSLFPIRYFSNPTYEQGKLAGTVVVFQDITERRRSEVEIARRNASLAIQNEVAAALSQSLEVEISLKSALETILDRMVMDVGFIFLWESSQKVLTLQLYEGTGSHEEIQALVSEQCACWRISNQAFTHMKTLSEPAGLDDADMPRYLVSTPLISKGQSIGVMTLGSSRAEPMRQHELDLLTAVGQQMGMAIENARLFQDAEQWASDMNRLQEAVAHLVSTFDEQDVKTLVVEQSTRLLDCQMACLLGWDEKKAMLTIDDSHGMDPEQEQIIKDGLMTIDLFAGLENRLSLISIPNLHEDSQSLASWREQLNLHAFLCLPIWAANQPLLYLCLFDLERARSWKPQEIELAESFAARAAVALMSARLHRQLEVAATLEERQRIAAEMHDGLAQTLGLLGLRVDQISEKIAQNGGSIADDIKSLRDAVTQASIDVRRSIASLRVTHRPRVSLQNQLSQMVERHAASGQPQIELINRLPQPLFLSKDQLQQVLPLMQEAVLNARNHSHATTIRILLEPLGDEVEAAVEDDGVGFDSNALVSIGNHFGLSIMQARAERIGGRLKIASTPGHGTQIVLTWQPKIHGEQSRRVDVFERKV